MLDAAAGSTNVTITAIANLAILGVAKAIRSVLWLSGSSSRVESIGRGGIYFPALLEPRRRSEQALLAVIQQTYRPIATRRAAFAGVGNRDDMPVEM